MPTTHFVSLAQAILIEALICYRLAAVLNLLAIGGVFFTIALLRFRKTIGRWHEAIPAVALRRRIGAIMAIHKAT
jgi:hypothetical protein